MLDENLPIIQVAPAPTAGIVSAPITVPTMGTPFMTLAAVVAVVARITAPARLLRIDRGKSHMPPIMVTAWAAKTRLRSPTFCLLATTKQPAPWN